MKTTFNLVAVAVLVVAAPASDAEPRPTCKAMCQRLTDCNMPSYVQRCLDNCKPHEASEEGRAQILAFTRYSCEQIRNSIPGANKHQPQRSPTQSGSARNPSTRTEGTAADDGLDRELDDAERQRGNDEDDDRRSRAVRGRGAGGAGTTPRGAGAPARGADGSRRPAAGRSSHSGDNCAPVCGRFDQCRLWKYDSCMGYCSSNTVDPAKNLSAAQWSCSRLGAWMQQLGVSGSSSRGDSRNSGNSGGVTCTAEASLGTTQGNMPTIYRTISAMGNGPTRGAASVKALKDCGALVGNAQSLAWLSGEQTEGGNCAISRCTQ
jgi:hypothetical protein